MISNISKLLATIASLVTIGFGIWHLFVPKLWRWYSYIDHEATELVLAVRAINVFFSTTLVLLGALTILFVYRLPADAFYVRTLLIVMTLLWGLRVVMQVIYPQGSINPTIQYGMLLTFTVVFLCFVVALLSLT